MPEQLESGAETIRKTTGFLTQLGEKLWNYLPTLLIALVVFLIGMLFARLLGKIVGKIASRTPRRPKIDKTASGFGISLSSRERKSPSRNSPRWAIRWRSASP